MDKGWRPRSLRRCFQVVHGHFGRVRACAHLVCVCVTQCSRISVSLHVCASASHCWGRYLSWHGNYVCIFIFPALLVCHQTCPDSSCPPGRPGSPRAPSRAPPPTLCPMLPRYATDARQLVCRLCGAGRLLETDARATVGPRLRICVTGPALGPRCDLYCWKRLWERVGSVSSSELISNGHTLY